MTPPPMDSAERNDRDIEKQAELDTKRLSQDKDIEPETEVYLILKASAPGNPNQLEELTTEIRSLTSAIYYLAQLIRERQV